MANINKWLKDHPVSAKFGAPMGRANTLRKSAEPQRLHMQKLRMVDGDYDASGAYWGGWSAQHGGMYCAFSVYFDIMLFVRARNPAEAKAKIREDYPDIKFKG